MIRSMTAYGRERAVLSGKEITVEIKSVNNRYLDTSIRLPRTYGYMEEKIKVAVTAGGITRGKVDVYVGVDDTGCDTGCVTLDTALADSYMKALDMLAERYRLTDDRTLMKVAENQALFCQSKKEENEERDWQDVETVLRGAVAAHIAAREREGAKLAADIREKKDRIAEIVPRIEELSAASLEKYRARLEEKITNVLKERELDFDRSRVLTEVAVFADKIAVDEETVRLRSHLSAFDGLLGEKEAVGRRFDFLLQEMNREVNTIGSKANDLQITQLVLEMKNILEKIREQIQNIE